MVWQDTSECLFKHLMRVKRIIRIRWRRSIKKNLILFTVIYYIFSRFPDSHTQYFPTYGLAPRRFPSPSTFSSGTAQPPANGGEPLRQATKREITSLFGHCCGQCCGHWCGSPSWLLKRSSKLTLCLECLCHGFFCFVFFFVFSGW